MNILLLSPYPERLLPTLMGQGDTVTCANGQRLTRADLWWKTFPDETWAECELKNFDFVICYGYRDLLSKDVLGLSEYPEGDGRVRFLNLHISLLPHNRGADPNFWSWFDSTPKGVSIHEIDAGVDTGAVLAQMEIGEAVLGATPRFPERNTLAATYADLHCCAVNLFGLAWPRIRAGEAKSEAQDPMAGSTHRKADRERIWHLFPQGWDTPVSEVERVGREMREGRVAA